MSDTLPASEVEDQTFSDSKIELEILSGIRHAEEDIVIAVQKALKTSQYPKDKLEDSQFRNLVRVATTTESPEVVKNFLRYQVGRSNKWGRGKGSLAEQIVQDIDGALKQQTLEILRKSRSRDKKKDEKRIHMELIRRYLGYGARCLKYLSLKPEEKIDV